MDEGTLTHKILADLLGVSETTIKSYRKKFPAVLPVSGMGKPIRFRKEAADICMKIRDLFALGSSVEEIDEQLFKEFAWRRPTTQADKNKKAPACEEQNVPDLSQSIAAALGNMAKSMVSLNDTNAQVLSVVKRIEEKLSGLERQVLESQIKIDAATRSSSVKNPAQNFFPEDLLNLPLLVRRPDGSYASAGGEKHGPISLRSVSSILTSAARTSGKYALSWIHDNCGIWIIITGEGARNAGLSEELRFTIHEITSAKGIKVLEIRNCLHNNEPRPGTALADFLKAAESAENPSFSADNPALKSLLFNAYISKNKME